MGLRFPSALPPRLSVSRLVLTLASVNRACATLANRRREGAKVTRNPMYEAVG